MMSDVTRDATSDVTRESHDPPRPEPTRTEPAHLRNYPRSGFHHIVQKVSAREPRDAMVEALTRPDRRSA